MRHVSQNVRRPFNQTQETNRHGGCPLGLGRKLCCAADARPIKITVRGTPGGLAADTWVEVVGEYAGLDAAAGRSAEIPVIKAESVRMVSAPAEPYES